MILKARHLYRVLIKNSRKIKNYCIIAPSTDIDLEEAKRYDWNSSINCIVGITITDKFCFNTSISFSFQGNCIFETPKVCDVFEMINRMRIENSEFKYDFKTGEIKRK